MSRRQHWFGALCAVAACMMLTAHASAQWMQYPPYAADDYAFTTDVDSVVVDVVYNDQPGSAPVDPSTVEIVTQSAFGVATVDPVTGDITYTPDPGTYGPIQIEYVVFSTEGLESNVAVLQVSVVTMPPTANPDSALTPYNWPVEIDVLSNDSPGSAELDPASIEIITAPSRGTVTVDLDEGTITYETTDPSAGSDSFEYRVSDVIGVESNVATVTVSISNDPPEIIEFNVSKVPTTGNWYVFSGVVDDEQPWLCSIRFGGLLDGHPNVTPNALGQFSFTVDFGQQVGGPSTAIAQDVAGQDSNVATVSIY